MEFTMRGFLFCLFTLQIFFGSIEAAEKKTICLNMIVKDESHVICRCLESVKSMIDYWVIVDTGSTDGTQEIIRNYMKDQNIDGELHERPWINFGHNRNEALQLAKGTADYILVIDADEVLRFSENFSLPELDKDFYFITTEFGGTKYGRVQLVNNHLNWKWEGVLHEGLCCKEARTSGTIANVENYVRSDGARSQDPQKFQKDALILEKALLDEPNNTRYVFYLAQSYKDYGDYPLAIKNYQKRVDMGGWDQEIFWSLFQIALIQQHINSPTDTVIESYMKAYEYRPSRVEPLYYLASIYRNQGNPQAGYNAAFLGLTMPKSQDVLFVEHWMYDYGLLFELSISAYWIEKYTEALLASNLLLANPNLPTHIREAVERNLVWIRSKLKPESIYPSEKAAA